MASHGRCKPSDVRRCESADACWCNLLTTNGVADFGDDLSNGGGYRVRCGYGNSVSAMRNDNLFAAPGLIRERLLQRNPVALNLIGYTQSSRRKDDQRNVADRTGRSRELAVL